MWITLFPLLAAAAPETESSPWKGTRWLIEIEETTPAPVELSAQDNYSFRTRALQLQAVLSCPQAAPFGKKIEVSCKIEAASLRATPRSMAPGEALHPSNQQVLDDAVERLTGTKVVFVLGADGRVNTVDLPEIPSGNRRESESRELLRRLAYDLVSGFSIEVPDDAAPGSRWTEKNSPLLRAPTQPGLLGGTKTSHELAQVEGMNVVQSTGEGAFSAPYIPWEFSFDGRISDSKRVEGGVGARGGGGLSPATGGGITSAGPQALDSTPTDRSFSGTLNSVTVLAPDSDLPQERVWAMRAAPTASSVGNMQGTSLYYAGKLRKLQPMEAVQLGPTEIIAIPGQSLEGLGTWIPISTL